MTDHEALTHRLDALEMRVSHQDRVIDDLNKVVTAQWRRIDGLARQIAHLGDRLKDAEAHGPSSKRDEPRSQQA